MTRALRFVVVLVVGLACLAWVGYAALSRITQGWFARDLSLRAQLAVAAARQSLISHWDDDRSRLAATLADIIRDERIMGAAACAPDGTTLAATEGYPAGFTCRALVDGMRREITDDDGVWTLEPELPDGLVHVSAIPVRRGDREIVGVVMVVQDLSFVGRREATTRNLLLVAFFVLAMGAALVTLLAARFAWRRWTTELRRALGGGASREFRPLLRDVRSLVERLAAERAAEMGAARWSPERLRETLHERLHGERVVLVANREPYIHERVDGVLRVLHPASGLVTALEPVMRACSGVWVAHGSGGADRDVVDGRDRVRVPPGEESYLLRRVWLTEREEEGYYYGFANEGLWPLCHLADTRPAFRAADFETYARVNRLFADAVCAEVDSEDPIVLVQDYHFALAPRMIRERLPRATIISFWHIPWPSAERIGICPWREELLSGMLGASVVGFQTQQHCNNFLDSVDAFMESRIDREWNAVVQSGRRTLVRPYPISVEWPVRWLAGQDDVLAARAAVRGALGLRPDALLGVGVDRLDYTKGIEERFEAVRALLERHPEFRGKFTFVQLAAPSRTKIERYRDLDRRVAALCEEINQEWGDAAGYRPVILLRAHHEPPEVFRYFRAADLCYVSSLHDGMNLVAKEFVAARDDEQGVLVLSQFTGAARDLSEALVVNPYDFRQAADALAAALRMPSSEQRMRMRSLRRLVAEFNVYRWAGRMLIDASELRRKERLTGRLGTMPARATVVTP